MAAVVLLLIAILYVLVFQPFQPATVALVTSGDSPQITNVTIGNACTDHTKIGTATVRTSENATHVTGYWPIDLYILAVKDDFQFALERQSDGVILTVNRQHYEGVRTPAADCINGTKALQYNVSLQLPADTQLIGVRHSRNTVPVNHRLPDLDTITYWYNATTHLQINQSTPLFSQLAAEAKEAIDRFKVAERRTILAENGCRSYLNDTRGLYVEFERPLNTMQNGYSLTSSAYLLTFSQVNRVFQFSGNSCSPFISSYNYTEPVQRLLGQNGYPVG